MPPNLEALSLQLIELAQKNATALELAEDLCFLLHTYVPGGLLLTDSTGKELVRMQNDEDLPLKSCSIPLYEAGFTIGSLSIQCTEKQAEFLQSVTDRCLPMLTLLLRWIRNSEETERLRRIEMVKSVINALSFSELEAVVQIFHVLEGEEGLLVAGRIADQLGMTRSVVVNALRKLEGTGVIETRSLGMKGTYIHVLNPLLAEELKKLRQ